MEPPDGCVCPITGQIFANPVLLPDGHTFEHSAIKEWLQTHSTSPVTNQEVGGCALTPNWAIKKVVEDWQQSTSDLTCSGSPKISTVTPAKAPAVLSDPLPFGLCSRWLLLVSELQQNYECSNRWASFCTQSTGVPMACAAPVSICK